MVHKHSLCPKFKFIMRTQLCLQILLIPFCFILFGDDVMLASSQCQNDQQSILIQLKNTLRFSSSSPPKLVSWNSSDTDCCKWEGVHCSSTGQIIGLDLSNQTISAGIDDSSVLFNLKNLESVNLAENHFSFTQIPSRFGSLLSLSYLNLSTSGFSGQIPSELSQLTSLEVLDLSSLYSCETRSLRLENPNLDKLVQNLTKLRCLYLDNVNISSQKFDWCQSLSSSLPHLEVLSLSNCHLSGPLNDTLQKLQSLSVILLALNSLSTQVPDFLANFKNLTVIHLGSCNLTGPLPEKILQLESLQILDLSANMNLSGSLPSFPINGSLQSLVLSNTNFSSVIPESIGNLKNLTRINLMGSDFSGKIPKTIGNLTQLAYLDLSFNKFIGQIPPFQKCKNLTHVDFTANRLSGMIPPAHFQDLQNLVSVNLGFNDFNGSIPSSLFSLQKLQQIQLSNNNFDGLLADFTNPSISSLETLDLSSNKLEGEIPSSFFKLGKLNVLLLSSNNLNGTIKTTEFQNRLSKLTTLDLSYNQLSIITSEDITLVSNLPKFSSLRLASCKLHKFPNLRNQTRLQYLDLSNNIIEGPIPTWIWAVGSGSLSYMNFSHNHLTGLQEPYNFPNINVLDLRSNNLSGVIPIPPRTATIIDYSNNRFNSSLPESIGRNLTYAYFFSVSNSLLTGVIPTSICNASYLKVLDLSSNRLNGNIPSCLIESSTSLGVLNLGNNSLSGQIEGTFPRNCGLNTLDLHENSIEGKIPKSLVNCTMLVVLNLGKNKINDTYPCSLGNNTNLHVLVLRSNRLHGSMHCNQNQHDNWSKLQIIDIASNNLCGVVPKEYFSHWTAMMNYENEDPPSKKHLSFGVFSLSGMYYQDTVTVTAKGSEMELVKILTVFTSFDISSNQFSGDIPSTIVRLRAFHVLNVSHNEFTGSIPPSMGNLRQLESLDMSWNRLTGEIPYALASLTFLSTLNLSYNQLRGRIPTGSQFQTFENVSYVGNEGLCGFPLNRNCSSSTNTVSNSQEDEDEDGNDWQSILYGMAVGAGSLTVLSVLYTLWKGYYPGTNRQTCLKMLISLVLSRYPFCVLRFLQ